MGLDSGANGKRRKLNSIDSISFHDIDRRRFFDTYVKTRTPVKIVNSVDLVLKQWKKFEADELEQFLNYDDDLLVESKVNGGFGGGEKRCKMSLHELLEKFKDGDDNFYLTTQYEEHNQEHEAEDPEEDDEEEESEQDDDAYELDQELNDQNQNRSPEEILEPEQDSDSDTEFDFDNLKDDYQESDDDETTHTSSLFQPPLTNIHNQLPVQPSFFESLIPQQINLWMGYNQAQNSEHQELDPKLTKYIPKGTSSGLHHDHADNLYILIQGTKRFTLFKPQDAYNLYTIGNIFKIYDNGVIDYECDEFAPNWNHIQDDGTIIEDEEEAEVIEKVKAKVELDPPNFSKIPSMLLHLNDLADDQLEKLMNFTKVNFPDLLHLDNFKVWLSPGDMLYLPAGWFHEVSSFGQANTDKLKNCHVALNYWFAPPNNLKFDQPYKTNYWKHQFETYSR